MAVFLAASDETDCGKSDEGTFFHCGFLAPKQDWENIFEPMWDARVLKGPPRITEFHVNDLKNKSKCEKNGIDLKKADSRISEAFGVISAIRSLTPIACELNVGHLRKVFESKVKFSTGALRQFEPDYLSFIGYVFGVLEHVRLSHPEAQKVDFVVERNGEITKRIQEFYETIPAVLELLGDSGLSSLMGDIIPAGKDHTPLHAADLLCWYTRRAHLESLEPKDLQRYSVIAKRKGARITWSDGDLECMYSACIEAAGPFTHT
jgi:hypothetical protein